jgi:hypothetical protein
MENIDDPIYNFGTIGNNSAITFELGTNFSYYYCPLTLIVGVVLKVTLKVSAG